MRQRELVCVNELWISWNHVYEKFLFCSFIILELNEEKKKLNWSCHIIKPLYLNVESYKFIPAVSDLSDELYFV